MQWGCCYNKKRNYSFLEDIKEVLGPINYGLGMANPEPYLDSLRDELAYKYEKMYELFDRVHFMVFKK